MFEQFFQQIEDVGPHEGLFFFAKALEIVVSCDDLSKSWIPKIHQNHPKPQRNKFEKRHVILVDSFLFYSTNRQPKR